MLQIQNCSACNISADLDITDSANKDVSTAIFATTAATYISSFILSPMAAEMMFTGKNWPSLRAKKSCFTHISSSTVHSLFIIAAGAYLLATGGLGNNSNPRLNTAIQQVTMAFYLVDFIAHILDKDLRETSQTPMHHVGASLGLLIGVYYQPYTHTVCFRVMTHITTPFTNMFYVLRSFNHKYGICFKVASVGMVVTSLLTRVSPMFWLWKEMYRVTFLSPNQAPWPVQTAAILLSVIFDVYNLLIVYRMIVGCAKYLDNNRHGQ